MRKLTSCFSTVLAGLILLAAASGVFCHTAQAAETMQVHLVVVGTTPDTDVQDFEALQKFFLDKAGGYTLIPNTAGGSMHEGLPKFEENSTSFLVAAKSDISEEIKSFMATRKGFLKPFILVWEAQRK